MEPPASELIDVIVRLPRSTVRQFMEARQCNTLAIANRRLAIAKALLSARQHRTAVFCGLRFVEPAWDMILALYIATHESRRTNVLKICAISGASNITALRVLESLEGQGYVVRKPDDVDARGVLIVMLPPLATALDGWIDTFSEMLILDEN